MSPKPSVVITGARCDIDAARAEGFVRVSDGTTVASGGTRLEADIRVEERCRERARIVQELHDTLFQGFLGASMLLEHAIEQTPESPSRPALDHVLRMVRQAIDEGRAAVRGIHTASHSSSSLEHAFSGLLEEVRPGQGVRLRFFVQGKPRAVNPVIQKQLFLIGREAIMNALRHSRATNIEIELRYLPHRNKPGHSLLHLFVRDDGCGIDPELVQKASDSHWGLRGMRDRADQIDARFNLWSGQGAGTEVHVATPTDIAIALA